MAATPSDYPVLLFERQSAWARWLERHHVTARGVWLRFGRKGAGLRTISYDEALDVALCYGWIDGQARGFDAESWLQRFTPRGARSVWSKRNREHVARLIATGAMRPAGLAAVEAAKADGRWERAYDSPASATVPHDFQAALDRVAGAQAFFDTLTRSQRYSILYAIQTAVKPETRARRIAHYVTMLRKKEKPR